MLYRNGFIWHKDLNFLKNMAININHIHMMIITTHQSSPRTSSPAKILLWFFTAKILNMHNKTKLKGKTSNIKIIRFQSNVAFLSFLICWYRKHWGEKIHDYYHSCVITYYNQKHLFFSISSKWQMSVRS